MRNYLGYMIQGERTIHTHTEHLSPADAVPEIYTEGAAEADRAEAKANAKTNAKTKPKHIL